MMRNDDLPSFILKVWIAVLLCMCMGALFSIRDAIRDLPHNCAITGVVE